MYGKKRYSRKPKTRVIRKRNCTIIIKPKKRTFKKKRW